MPGKPKLQEQYTKGNDLLNYVIYTSTTMAGDDEVLQHKINGTTESAHVTLHPNGTVNVTVVRSKDALAAAIRSNLAGYKPGPSRRLLNFLAKVQSSL